MLSPILSTPGVSVLVGIATSSTTGLVLLFAISNIPAPILLVIGECCAICGSALLCAGCIVGCSAMDGLISSCAGASGTFICTGSDATGVSTLGVVKLFTGETFSSSSSFFAEVNKSINAINKSITPLVIKIPGKVKNHPGLKLMNSKIFILSPSPLLFYFNDNKKRRKNQFFSSLHFYFTQFNVFHGSEFGGEISKVITSFFTGCSNSSL